MRVAVGSSRAPKVEAARRALAGAGERHARFRGAELVAVEVPSAPAMPLSLAALQGGARERAERARASSGADLGIGLEGGLELQGSGPGRRAFLMSWAYVTDGRRGHFGCGGAIELPDGLVARVADEGLELAQAVDALTSRRDVRSREGAWGVLTAGWLDRTHSFELALVNALAPFYNTEVYA